MHISCLVPNRRALDRFLAAVEGLEFASISAVVWVHGSDEFSRANMGCTVEQHLLENKEISRALEGSKIMVRAYVSGAFHCPFSGKVPIERAANLAEQLVSTVGNATELVLADTLGAGLVDEVRQTIKQTRKLLPVFPLGLHLHNTRGYSLGVISMAVEELGIRSFEGSVAGCPTKINLCNLFVEVLS